MYTQLYLYHTKNAFLFRSHKFLFKRKKSCNGLSAVLRMVKGGYLCSYNHILLTQLGLSKGFRNWVSKVFGCPFFRGRAQYTIINIREFLYEHSCKYVLTY